MSRHSVAVIGASRDRSKFGNKCVRAYLQAGYRVYPIHPQGGEIEGLPVFATLGDLPVAPDRISIYVPPPITRALLPKLTQYPEAEVWFNPGCADSQILADARVAGVDVRDGCSIVDIGLSPSQFP